MLKLYHFSDVCCEILIPQFGGDRIKDEDPRVRDKQCIWFTNEKSPVNGKPSLYCYIVEIDENDPNLIEDEKVTAMMKDKGNIRWYAYLKEIEPIERLVRRN